MRILIADDDCTSRILLEGMIRKYGHDVQVAVDGREALLALQQADAPPLAILDWMMPEMDGLEVVRGVRSRQTDRPPYIIMLTARGNKADIVTGLDAGANDYLTKPFDPGELRARVSVGCRMVQLQEELAARIDELCRAFEEIKTLHGILPICCNCKKIRDDQGYWRQVEVYFRDHADVNFSHGLCPECMNVLYPELCEDAPAGAPGKK
jgi:DNA-binding response OmpR family regulator